MSNIYEMIPEFESRVSYYGKARIIEHDDGTKTLISYNTKVLNYDPKTDTFTSLWGSWSATTGRHINEFAKQMTGKGMNKAEYLSL